MTSMSAPHQHSSSCFRRLVWHRRDLRLEDNDLYEKADGHNSLEVIPVFVVDPSEHQPAPSLSLKGLKTVSKGPVFSIYLLKALSQLREDLWQSGNCPFWVRKGDPLTIIPHLAQECHASEVVWSEEPGPFEVDQSERMKQKLSQSNISFRTVCSCTLFHPSDLPRGPDVWQRLARPNEKRRKSGATKRRERESTVSTDTGSKETPPNCVDVSVSRFSGLPLIMGDFRRAARSHAPIIRPPLPRPSRVPFPSDLRTIDPGPIPTLDELTSSLSEANDQETILGLPPSLIQDCVKCARAMIHDNNDGCQKSIMQQTTIHTLQEFLEGGWAARADRALADVSNRNSSRLSEALAVGTLSPRQIYHCIRDADIQGCEWLISHMEMRDFFVFNAFAKGRRLFCPYGQPVHGTRKKRQETNSSKPVIVWKDYDTHSHLFVQWAMGETRLPFVDAGMRELRMTGYCSNRVRQNMASVLTKDLGLDWRLGAEWFQFCLGDHCVAANYGNWAYFSGVGGDPKNRHFRTVSQALRYDRTGDYVKRWCPMLRDLAEQENFEMDGNNPKSATSPYSTPPSNDFCLRPWDFSKQWPTPIVDPLSQLSWQDLKRLQETGSLSSG